MTQEQYNYINAWQKETFGSATSLSKVFHLEKEVHELKKDLIDNNKDKILEFADCFILLFGAAYSDGMTYADICNAINEKMAININQKWGKPDKDGVVNHIK
jgi:hypothetical protein